MKEKIIIESHKDISVRRVYNNGKILKIFCLLQLVMVTYLQIIL